MKKIIFIASILIGLGYTKSNAQSDTIVEIKIVDKDTREGVKGVEAFLLDKHGESIKDALSKPDGCIIFSIPKLTKDEAHKEYGEIVLYHEEYWDDTIRYKFKNNKIMVEKVKPITPYKKNIELELWDPETNEQIKVAHITLDYSTTKVSFDSTTGHWNFTLAYGQIFKVGIHTDIYEPTYITYRIEEQSGLKRIELEKQKE